MRIYRRAEFLKLPEGTIYAKGREWVFGGLEVKFDTSESGNDWWSLDPCWIASERGDDAFDRLDEMLTKGVSYPMQDVIARDGMHEENDIFLVFEPADLLNLRDMIDAAVVAGGKTI